MLKLETIHNDFRGAIHSITGNELKYPELVILTAKKDVARGGCIHNKSNEYFFVIQGKVIYYIGNINKGKRYSTGMGGVIPKKTPHYFIALEDSIVLEWGATPEEKINKHKEFRKMVDDINDGQK